MTKINVMAIFKAVCERVCVCVSVCVCDVVWCMCIGEDRKRERKILTEIEISLKNIFKN